MLTTLSGFRMGFRWPSIFRHPHDRSVRSTLRAYSAISVSSKLRKSYRRISRYTCFKMIRYLLLYFLGYPTRICMGNREMAVQPLYLSIQFVSPRPHDAFAHPLLLRFVSTSCPLLSKFSKGHTVLTITPPSPGHS